MPTESERKDYLLSDIPSYPSENMAEWIRIEAEKNKEPWESEMDQQLWERGQAREFKKKFPAEKFRDEKTYEAGTKWLKEKTKERLVAKNILDASGVTDEYQTRLLAPWDQTELMDEKTEKASNLAQPAEALAKSEVANSITVNAAAFKRIANELHDYLENDEERAKLENFLLNKQGPVPESFEKAKDLFPTSILDGSNEQYIEDFIDWLRSFKKQPAAPAESAPVSDAVPTEVGASLTWKGQPHIVRAADEEAFLFESKLTKEATWVPRALVESALIYDDKSYRHEQEEKADDGAFEADNLVENKDIKNAALIKTAKGVEVPLDTLVDWLFEQAEDVATLVEPTSVQRYLEAWGLKFSDKDILNIVTIVLQRQKQLSKMQDKAPVPVEEEPLGDGPMEPEEPNGVMDDRKPAESPRSLPKPGPSSLPEEMP